ncbi:MAG: hypothetical protein PHX72_02195, partial [Candidatus Shapirobacteria bacterium]|nr:hypothetical protein [Candidatus Shapirobacteria bacterium]
MSVIGLDIGSSSIKVAKVAKVSGGFQLVALGKIATPQPGLLSESPNDHEVVAEAVKKLFADVGIQDKQVI